MARLAQLPGKLVNRVIEVARHIIDVTVAPAQADNPLPAAHLESQSVPVTRLPVGAPVHLGGVAFDAMRRIKQFAACGNRFGRWLRVSQTCRCRERDKADQQTDPCGVRAVVSSNGGNVVHAFMVEAGCVCTLIWIMRKLFW